MRDTEWLIEVEKKTTVCVCVCMRERERERVKERKRACMHGRMYTSEQEQEF